MIPHIQLTDGVAIPQLGLGLWKNTNSVQFKQAFDAAYAAGYRHFDTAQIYKNEHLLGQAWRESGSKRTDLFITTKISVTHFTTHAVRNSFTQSLAALQTDYVDLLLLHFPVTGLRKGAWKILEELKAAGGARSIGVSNYTVRHLKEMKQYAKVLPAVNQVELHVFLQQPELVEYCRNEGIALEAYSPLAHAKAMDVPLIQHIAAKHAISYAQVMIRWCIQSGFIVIPKSISPARIQENAAVFDITLDEDDMEAIKNIGVTKRTCWDPTLVP